MPLWIVLSMQLLTVNVAPEYVGTLHTPLDIYNGYIAFATVERAGDPSRELLETKVYLARLGAPELHWQMSVVDTRTIPDTYHTIPSVAFDRDGYIHVAYNMHNMPWQYSVSTKPFAIDDWAFRGELINDAQINAVYRHNKTPFPNAGAAAIPGTQITYPAFFKDRRGALFLTYRFARNPERMFLNRSFSGAIAKYEEQTKRWRSVGAVAVAGAFQWTAYPPRLAFDSDNVGHVVWTWRRFRAGRETIRPTYMRFRALDELGGHVFESASGQSQSLPIAPQDLAPIVSGDHAYYAPIELYLNSHDEPSVILHRPGRSREQVSLAKESGRWRPLTPVKDGAHKAIYDGDRRLWLFANGPLAIRHAPGRDIVMEKQQIAQGWCEPRVKADSPRRKFYLLARHCERDEVALWRLDWD